MPEPKCLWRAAVRRIPRPIYLVAQNLQSAQAQIAAHPQVDPADITMIQRIDPWNDQQNMTVVIWPEPPAPPHEEPEPPP